MTAMPGAPDPRAGRHQAGAAGDLTPLDLDADTEALYRVVLRNPGDTVDVFSDRTGVPVPALPARLQPLVDLRLVRIEDDRVRPEPPDLALGRLVNERTRVVQQEQDRLATLRAAIPDLVQEHERGRTIGWEPAAIEVIGSADLVDTMESLVRHSTGELLFLRPDQFSLPSGQRMDEVVAEALREGRRSRSLYPTSIGDDVPDRVRARAAAGERVRVIPAVPARLAVFGTQAVVVTEHWGTPVGRRLVVRQPAVVHAIIALFDAYWDRGVSLPGLGERDDHGSERLLALLARGVKDEQAARLLGVSLRTVRRRVADLMQDLGVESRFQAGMEAVRRGLL